VGAELAAAVASRRAAALEAALMEAARAYERERWREARRLLAPIAKAAPDAPAVRELHGLVLYRLGRWAEAARELEAFRALSGSCEQHPVLADCYRALGRHERVEALWDELRRASPGAALVAEGRIVMAGSLADRGRLEEAIALLERAPVRGKRPAEHHVRVWYALADLYERAGDLPRARELFRRVVEADPELADAPERLAALG
jgi:tetratricopeptide (TPR) repeat protein